MTLSRLSFALAALCLAASAHAAPSENLPQGARLTKIESRHASIELRTPFEYAQLVLTGSLDNGDKIDVTRMVTFAPSANFKVSATGQVRPVADGKAALAVSLG